MNSYFIYKCNSNFEKKHVRQYLEGIGVMKFDKIHLLLTVFKKKFIYFLLFTI